MESWQGICGDLVKLCTEGSVLFDDLEEVRREIANIRENCDVVLEKMFLGTCQDKPLKECRSTVKDLIHISLGNKVGELEKFCKEKEVEFKDPITERMILDPVTLNETSELYDRNSLLEYFKTSSLDPISKRRLRSKGITDCTYIKRKIDMFLTNVRDRAMSLFSGPIRDFVRYSYPDVIIVAGLPMRICRSEGEEVEGERESGTNTSRRELVDRAVSILEKVCQYVGNKDVPLLRLLEFYFMKSFFHPNESGEKKVEKLVKMRMKILERCDSSSERIRILENELLYCFPNSAFPRSLRKDLYYQLLELYNNRKEVFNIIPSLLRIIDRSAEKKELVTRYLKVFPNNYFLRLESIPFMSNPIDKSRNYFEIAKELFHRPGKRGDAEVEDFLVRSIQHDLNFTEAQVLLLKLLERRCKQCSGSIPEALRVRAGKQAIVLSDLQKPGDESERMRYLEKAYEYIPNEPGLKEDLVETYTSLGEIEKLHYLTTSEFGDRRHEKEEQSTESVGQNRFFFTMFKKLLKDNKLLFQLNEKQRMELDRQKQELGKLKEEIYEMKRKKEEESDPFQMKSDFDVKRSKEKKKERETQKKTEVEDYPTEKYSRGGDSGGRRDRNDRGGRRGGYSSSSSSSRNGRDSRDSPRGGRRSPVDSGSRYSRGRGGYGRGRSDGSRGRRDRDNGDDGEFYESYSRPSRYNNDRRNDRRGGRGREEPRDRDPWKRNDEKRDPWKRSEEKRDSPRRRETREEGKRKEEEERRPPRPRRDEDDRKKREERRKPEPSPRREERIKEEKPDPVSTQRKEEEKRPKPKPKPTVEPTGTTPSGRMRGNVFEIELIVDHPRSGTRGVVTNSEPFEAFGYSWRLRVDVDVNNRVNPVLLLLTDGVRFRGNLTLKFSGRELCSRDFARGERRVFGGEEHDTRTQWMDTEEQKREKERDRWMNRGDDVWIGGVGNKGIGFPGGFESSESAKWVFEVRIEKRGGESDGRLGRRDERKIQDEKKLEKRYDDPFAKRLEEIRSNDKQGSERKKKDQWLKNDDEEEDEEILEEESESDVEDEYFKDPTEKEDPVRARQRNDDFYYSNSPTSGFGAYKSRKSKELLKGVDEYDEDVLGI